MFSDYVFFNLSHSSLQDPHGQQPGTQRWHVTGRSKYWYYMLCMVEKSLRTHKMVVVCLPCNTVWREASHSKVLSQHNVRRLITPQYVDLLSVEKLTPDLMFIFHVIFFLEFEFLQFLHWVCPSHYCKYDIWGIPWGNLAETSAWTRGWTVSNLVVEKGLRDFMKHHKNSWLMKWWHLISQKTLKLRNRGGDWDWTGDTRLVRIFCTAGLNMCENPACFEASMWTNTIHYVSELTR